MVEMVEGELDTMNVQKFEGTAMLVDLASSLILTGVEKGIREAV